MSINASTLLVVDSDPVLTRAQGGEVQQEAAGASWVIRVSLPRA